MENRFCVYTHINKITEQVFYVGIGTGYRPNRYTGRNRIWNRIVKKYGFYVEIVAEGKTWDEACQMEKELIKKFGKLCDKSGILANITDGGEGAPGGKWNIGSKRTNESRLKISEALKGRCINPKAVKNSVEAKKLNRIKRNGQPLNPRKPVSQMTKDKISSAKKGTKLSEATREKISQSLKGRFFSEETRRKNSESLKGRTISIETRQKISATLKSRHIKN